MSLKQSFVFIPHFSSGSESWFLSRFKCLSNDDILVKPGISHLIFPLFMLFLFLFLSPATVTWFSADLDRRGKVCVGGGWFTILIQSRNEGCSLELGRFSYYSWDIETRVCFAFYYYFFFFKYFFLKFDAEILKVGCIL